MTPDANADWTLPETVDGWTRSPQTGVLSRSIGSWGERQRLFQKRVGGPFYCSAYLTDGRRHVRSFGTSDPTEVLRIVANTLKVPDGRTHGAEREQARGDVARVTLGRLWDRYRRDCETFRDTDGTHKSDTATRAAMLIAYFGADFDVTRLNRDAQRRYERARAAGGLRYRHERRVVRGGRVHTETIVHLSQPTRARSAEADLVLLHAMLNWATTVRRNGTRWLSANPLKGIERRPEKNPRRPVTCQERFDATRKAIQARAARIPVGSVEQFRWIRLELALVLAEATGRRIGAIRQLRWEEPWSAPRGESTRRRTSAQVVATSRHTTRRLGSNVRLGVVRRTVPKVAPSPAKVAPPPRK